MSVILYFSQQPDVHVEAKKEKSFIITLNPTSDEELISKLENKHKFKSTYKYKHAFKGFSTQLDETTLNSLLTESEVLSVEQVSELKVELFDVVKDDKSFYSEAVLYNQTNTNTTPLPTDDFSSVHCYILDTGINPNHVEFNPGQVVLDYNAITGTKDAQDDNNHGTGVASTVGGKTVGCASKVTLHAIKVLDSNGSGYTSSIVSGIDWIIANKPNGPCIINMSFGGSFSSSLNTAVTKAMNNGILCVCASGNSGGIACNYSPASATNIVSASAVDSNYNKPSWANYGSCVTAFAPGVSIYTAWQYNSNTSYAYVSGTSFSSPITCGILCRYLKEVPTSTQLQAVQYLNDSDKLGLVLNGGTNSPNKFTYWDPTKVGKICTCP